MRVTVFPNPTLTRSKARHLLPDHRADGYKLDFPTRIKHAQLDGGGQGWGG